MDKNRKRLKRFSIIYLVTAIILAGISAVRAVAVWVFGNSLVPEFTYYGNDAVSGWATIFSGLGYMAAVAGKIALFLIVVLLFIFAVYWAVGIMIDLIMRSRLKQGRSVKASGIVLSVWTMIPGAVLLFSVVGTAGALAVTSVLTLIGAALFLFAGIYLLVLCLKAGPVTGEYPQIQQ